MAYSSSVVNSDHRSKQNGLRRIIGDVMITSDVIYGLMAILVAITMLTTNKHCV